MKRRKIIILSLLVLLLISMTACSGGGLTKPIPVDENNYPNVSQDEDISNGKIEVEVNRLSG